MGGKAAQRYKSLMGFAIFPFGKRYSAVRSDMPEGVSEWQWSLKSRECGSPMILAGTTTGIYIISHFPKGKHIAFAAGKYIAPKAYRQRHRTAAVIEIIVGATAESPARPTIKKQHRFLGAVSFGFLISPRCASERSTRCRIRDGRTWAGREPLPHRRNGRR